MPYTNTWSDTIPLGSVDADFIDDHIRQLRLDLRERMDDVVVDWTADPVVLDTSGIGPQTGIAIYYHNSILQARFDEDDVRYDGSGQGDYFESDNESDKEVYGRIGIPVGGTLTGFEVTLDVQAGGSVTMDLRYVIHSTGVSASVGSNTETTAGIRQLGLGVLSHTIVDGRAYYVRLNNNNSVKMRIYSFKATLDVTGLSQYISG